MSQENNQDVQSFLDRYQPRRNLDVYPDGNKELPAQAVREQSDISVTSVSTLVHDYGLRSMSMHKRQVASNSPQNFHVRSSSLHAGDVKEGIAIVAESGRWSESGPASQAAKGMEQELDNLSFMDSATKSDCIETLLHNATLEAAEGAGGAEWLPASALNDICRHDIVRRDLEREFPTANSELISKYVEYVCGGPDDLYCEEMLSRRIFVILVMIGKVIHLPQFIRADMRDEHLPFLWVDSSRKSLYSPSLKDERASLSCFDKNNIALMKKFYLAQWQILVPFISRDSDNEVKEYQLHRDTIMPWTWFAGPERDSGFARVRRVEIHEAHHTFHNNKSFALKTLKEENPIQAAKEFRSELHVFMKMKPEKHLLELYATFKKENASFKKDSDGLGLQYQYSFLFPWAHGGSLETLWTKAPSKLMPGMILTPRLFLTWIAEQCHGLASGLQSIHDLRKQALKRTKLEESKREIYDDYYGIHGDIKPENILHFDQHEDARGLGILKIADFGLTEFHTMRSRTVKAAHSHRPAPAPTYQAPELVVPEGYFSRKADIWSLGCVFAQFLSWVILGGDSVEEFDRRRLEERDFNFATQEFKKVAYDRFFKVEFLRDGEVKTSLKASVKEWLTTELYQKIQKDGEQCFLTDFLKLIRHQMLESQRERRIECEDLVKSLANFVDKSRSPADDPYWTVPIPSFEDASPETELSHNPPKATLNGPVAAMNLYSGRAKRPSLAYRKVSFQPIEDTKES